MRAGLQIAVSLSLLAVLTVASPPVLAQQSTGTLQPPSRPTPPTAPTPPSAAPRTPVQQSGGGQARTQPPVVKPHSEPHRQKPAAQTAKTDKGKPAPAKPEPVPAPQVEAAPEKAEKLPEPEKPEGAPSRLPRFAALRSDEVNMRVGPGSRYRIEWVYKRRDMPVEIEREFDVWRWVQDPDGNKGWVHQATLMGRRNFIVQKADATLRSEPSDRGSAVAVLKPGVIGRIRSCEAAAEWCNVQAGGYRGFLRRSQFWGTLPGEAVGP
ncbi:MAG: SH3 domain-containing protein [Acetobacteraceae bacterium]|nr:hypothetical protein [Pseudomonadota bacterium]